MTVQRKVRISAEFMEDLLCGDLRRAKSNCPRDIRVVGASFEAGTVVLDCQSKVGWPDEHLSFKKVYFEVVFDALVRSGE